jgi:hypothetical protein
LRARIAKPQWTAEDKYVKAVIKEAERRWKKNRNLYDVVRLLDNFPRLLEPTVITGFPWILEALCMIFMNRKYDLFAELDATLNAGGAHKSDVNYRTFRKYLYVFRYLRQVAILDWIRKEHSAMVQMIIDDDRRAIKKYLQEHKLIKPPKEILLGLRTRAKNIVCQQEKISEETFKLRIKRARKEPAVMRLIRTTSILGEADSIMVLPDPSYNEEPGTLKNRKRERA